MYLTTSNTNTGATNTYVGRVLVDRAATSVLYYQNIHMPWLFKHDAGIGCNKIQYIDGADETLGIDHKKGTSIKLNDTAVEIKDKDNNTLASVSTEEITLNKKTVITSGGLSVTGSITGSSDIIGNKLKATTSISASSADITGSVTVGSLTSTGICQAVYFNATSDLRAKKDIIDYEFSDVFIDDMLTAMVTYHFKNQADNDPLFIGLIAQQVVSICVKHDIDPRMFVNNLDASGVNDDYMSLNLNNLMFLFAQGLKHTRQKQLDLSMRLNVLEGKVSG